eukprot:gene4188-7498_t
MYQGTNIIKKLKIKGDACEFRHSELVKNKPICLAFQTTEGCNNDKCTDRHVFATPCSYFLEGKCAKGNACAYLHDASQIPDAEELKIDKKAVVPISKTTETIVPKTTSESKNIFQRLQRKSPPLPNNTEMKKSEEITNNFNFTNNEDKKSENTTIINQEEKSEENSSIINKSTTELDRKDSKESNLYNNNNDEEKKNTTQKNETESPKVEFRTLKRSFVSQNSDQTPKHTEKELKPNSEGTGISKKRSSPDTSPVAMSSEDEAPELKKQKLKLKRTVISPPVQNSIIETPKVEVPIKLEAKVEESSPKIVEKPKLNSVTPKKEKPTEKETLVKKKAQLSALSIELHKKLDEFEDFLKTFD